MQVSAMASNASVYTLAIFAPALLRGRGKNLLVGEFPNPPAHANVSHCGTHFFEFGYPNSRERKKIPNYLTI